MDILFIVGVIVIPLGVWLYTKHYLKNKAEPDSPKPLMLPELPAGYAWEFKQYVFEEFNPKPKTPGKDWTDTDEILYDIALKKWAENKVKLDTPEYNYVCSLIDLQNEGCWVSNMRFKQSHNISLEQSGVAAANKIWEKNGHLITAGPSPEDKALGRLLGQHSGGPVY